MSSFYFRDRNFYPSWYIIRLYRSTVVSQSSLVLTQKSSCTDSVELYILVLQDHAGTNCQIVSKSAMTFRNFMATPYPASVRFHEETEALWPQHLYCFALFL